MLVALGLAVLGFIVGPMLGIVVDRVVERESPAPVLRCPVCATDMGPPLPLRMWTARCSTDPSHRRWRYPALDVVTAALFFVAGLTFELSWQLLPYLVAFAVLAILAVVDFETHLLVNTLTYPLMAGVAFAVLVLSTPNDFADGMSAALIGGLLFGGILGLAFIIYPPGLGLGDVKLAPSLGMLLGWLTTSWIETLSMVLWALILGLLSGAVVGLVVRARFRRRSEDEQARIRSTQPEDWLPGEVAMGPFLVLGTAVIIALSTPAALI